MSDFNEDWLPAVNRRRFAVIIWFLAFFASLVLTAANLYYGDLNQDEGWYLYAARLVSRGQLPYRDFAFTQGPVMPFVYAAAEPLVASAGVAAGRLFTAFLGIAGALCAALLAARLSVKGRRGYSAVLAFVLIAVNVYQSYFCTVVKTYSLCSLLLVLGFLALSFMNRRHGGIYAALSGVFLSLAAGTRISAAIILPIVFLFLLFRRRSTTGGSFRWLWFGLSAAATCCLVFGYFLLACPGNLFFGLLQYHSGRAMGTLGAQMVYKAGFVSRVVQAYFVAIALGIAVVLWRAIMRCRGDGESGDQQSCAGTAASAKSAAAALPYSRTLSFAVLLSALGVTLVHFCAPFPYDDYQAAVFALFAVVLGVEAVRLPDNDRAVSWLAVTVLFLSLASAFSSPINQAWFVREHDRIWWRLKDKPPLRQLQEVGSALRALAEPDVSRRSNLSCEALAKRDGADGAKPDGRILTQDTYLAVEAGLSVPAGLELGPFSYYPEWDEKTARERHVLNRAMLKDLMMNCDAPVAAFSGYGLAIQAPVLAELPPAEQRELWQTLLTRYRIIDEIGHFGQELTTLRILVRRDANEAQQ